MKTPAGREPAALIVTGREAASPAMRATHAVNFGDGKNFGFGTRQTAAALYGFSQSLGGKAEMQEYRAYIMGLDGHVQSRVDLRCKDESEAIERAQQLVDGHDVELWQLDRQIRTFKHTRDGFTLVVRGS